MQIERRRAGNRSARGAECGNSGDASSTGGAIAVLRVQRNPNPRRANEAEPLRPLLRHYNTFATTNQIGIKEAPASNQPRMRDRRITDASQCGNKFRTKTRARGICPTSGTLCRGAEWHTVCWDRAAIHPPWRSVEVYAEKFPNNGANPQLHRVVVTLIAASFSASRLRKQQQ
jgi:hypothetical protein